MSRTRLVFLLVFALVPPLALPQQTAPPAAKDPQAITILQTSLSAMGASALSSVQDTLTTLQMTGLQLDGTIATLTGTAKTLGSALYRLDLGDLSTVFNSQAAFIKMGTDPVIVANRRAIANAGVRHIPVLSVLNQLANADFKVTYVGLESLNNAQVHHVQMQLRFYPADLICPLAPRTGSYDIRNS